MPNSLPRREHRTPAQREKILRVSPSGSKPAKEERFKTSHPEVINSYHFWWYKQGVSIAS